MALTQQFGPQNLVFGPGLGGLLAGQQTGMNMESERLGQQKTLEDIYASQQNRDIASQKLPLELERMRGENSMYPGKLTELTQRNEAERKKIDREDYNYFLQDLTKMPPGMDMAGQAAYLNDVSKRNKIPVDHPAYEAALKAYNAGPEIFKRYQEALQVSPEARYKEEQQNARSTEQRQSQESIAAGNRASAKELEQMRIDAGKYTKLNKFSAIFDDQMARAKNAVEKLAVVNEYLGKAATDPELADTIPKLRALAAQLEPQAKAELDRMKPPGLNVPAVTGLPAAEQPSLSPGGGGASWAPAPQAAPAPQGPVPPGATKTAVGPNGVKIYLVNGKWVTANGQPVQ